jgi:hypothetical protein
MRSMPPRECTRQEGHTPLLRTTNHSGKCYGTNITRKTALVALAVGLVGYTLGFTQDKFAVYGQGNQSCGQWIEKNKVERDTHLNTWIIGFVSGAGYVSNKVLRSTDSAGMATWIDAYCAKRPLDTLSTASSRLVDELSAKR